MSMNIDSKLNNENGFWDVSLQGELDVSTADKLKEHLHNLADEKILDMKINLENLDYIDSTGLGAMIGVLKKLKTDNKEIYIINPKSNVKKIFTIEDIKVAVSEACTNAIKHSDDKSVSITYTILENGLDIEIKDNGKGYDVESIATPDLTQPKENGLGLFIIQTLMDDVKIESKDNQGTIIKMTKYLGVDI